MRDLKSKLLLVVTVVLFGWVTEASAQITTPITFSTKFPFTVGDTRLPAGSYTIRPLDNEPDLLEVSSADGKTSVLVETLTAELRATPSKGEVVFRKYGDNYVLSQVFDVGAKTGALAIKSNAEKQHAKKASGSSTTESVAIAKNP